MHFYYFSPLYLIDYPRTVDFAINVILINVNFNQGYVAVVKAELRTLIFMNVKHFDMHFLSETSVFSRPRTNARAFIPRH